MQRVETAAQELVAFLKDETAPHLQGVAGYTDDGLEFVQIRDDVMEARLREDVERLIDHLRAETKEAEEAAFQMGALNVTVRCFDEGIVLHFPFEQRRGIIVALDRPAAADLTTFTRKCLDQIHTNPPV